MGERRIDQRGPDLLALCRAGGSTGRGPPGHRPGGAHCNAGKSRGSRRPWGSASVVGIQGAPTSSRYQIRQVSRNLTENWEMGAGYGNDSRQNGPLSSQILRIAYETGFAFKRGSDVRHRSSSRSRATEHKTLYRTQRRGPTNGSRLLPSRYPSLTSYPISREEGQPNLIPSDSLFGSNQTARPTPSNAASRASSIAGPCLSFRREGQTRRSREN